MRKILIGKNNCLSKKKKNPEIINNPNLRTCQPKATINTTKVE